MNSEEASKTIISGKLFVSDSCWITNHFGIKPVKGGRPPNEKSLKNKVSLKIGLVLNLLIKWLKWNVWVKYNIEIIDSKIKEYIVK